MQQTNRDTEKVSNTQEKRRSRKKEWMESKKQADPTFMDRIRDMGKEYAKQYRKRLKESKIDTIDNDVLRVLVSKLPINQEDTFVKTIALLNTNVNGQSIYQKLVSDKRRVNSILISAIYVCTRPYVKASQFVKTFDISLPTLLNVSKDIDQLSKENLLGASTHS